MTNKHHDLMSSHLVKEAPRFSKFVHGIAQLFEDNVNNFPFWMGELENDIRRDPETAFHQEQERLAKQAEDDIAVGSFLGSSNRMSPRIRASMGSPGTRFTDIGSPSRASRPSQAVPLSPRASASQPPRPEPSHQETPAETDRVEGQSSTTTMARLASLFPSFPVSRSSRTVRDSAPLPPGVKEPGTWIKDSGPVRVESKVWLANQRTFIKWLHISILLSSLSLGLYNAAGKHNDVARALSIVYTAFALFSAGWGWYMYEKRAMLIRQRSGKDLDNIFGPLVVCLGLAVALVLNFAFKYSSALKNIRGGHEPDVGTPGINSTASWKLVNQAQQVL